MENVYKKAQQSGIQASKQYASQALQAGGVRGSANTAMWERSAKTNDINMGALNALTNAVENYAAGVDNREIEAVVKQNNEDYVKGQLAAQTGQAMEDNPSKWTQRGYEIFKKSADLNKFVAQQSVYMDKYADMDNEQYAAHLQQAFKGLEGSTEDTYIQSELSKMFTNASGKLVADHNAAYKQNVLNKSINVATENLKDASLIGETLDSSVMEQIKATEETFGKGILSKGIVTDAAYQAMIQNNDVKLYEKLRDDNYLDDLDNNTKNQMARTYLSIQKANQKAMEKEQKDYTLLSSLEKGRLDNPMFTDADRNRAFNLAMDKIAVQYPGNSKEASSARASAIVDLSARNNYINNKAVEYYQNSIANPVTYIEGKPIIKGDAVSSFFALASVKRDAGDGALNVLSKVTDEETRVALETVDDMLPMGILHSGDEDIKAAILTYQETYHKAASDAGKTTLTTAMESSEYLDGKDSLSNRVKQKWGQGFLSEAWSNIRSLDEAAYNMTTFGVVDQKVQPSIVRGIPIKDTSKLDAAYTNEFRRFRLKKGMDDKSAANYAARSVANKARNFAGNVYMDDFVVGNQRVTMPELFGLQANASDDDVSEKVLTILADNLDDGYSNIEDKQYREAFLKNIQNADIQIDPYKDEMTISFSGDFRNTWQKMTSSDWLSFLGDQETNEKLENLYTTQTVSISSIRNYIVGEQLDMDDTKLKEELNKTLKR